VEWVPR